MKAYDLTISIVTYKNDPVVLRKIFDSLGLVTLKAKVYVVDNSPTDEIRSLCTNYRIEYLFNDTNLGFAAGHNIAIRKAISLSNYHVVMNPDIYFDAGMLEKIFSFAESNLDIGLLMPKILYPDDSPQYLCKLLPTCFDLVLRRFIPFRSLRESRNERYELRFTGYNRIMDVPCLSGCFMFLRMDVLQQVGLFDERFFMYLEDFDLSRRISRWGRVVYYPEALVYHEYEKGSYKHNKLLAYHIWSAVKYFNKWGWFFDKERDALNRECLRKLAPPHIRVNA